MTIEPGASPTTLSGLRVLLVDDSVDTLEAFSELLELEGADVTAAAGGSDALRAVALQAYDILISDIAMPGMDGYELLARLRQDPATAGLPAIALTGYGEDKEENLRVGGRGFDAHLGKPVFFETLLITINKLVKER